MTLISLPIWAFSAAVGIPSISLFWLVLSLIRRKRKARQAHPKPANATPWPERQILTDQFRQNLNAIQIDAVFNGLVALIETERLKLKALMGINIMPETSQETLTPDSRNERMENTAAQPNPEDHHAPCRDIDQQIAQCAADGKNPAAIAGQLGLSLAEVDLAMKIRASKAQKNTRKLEAVA